VIDGIERPSSDDTLVAEVSRFLYWEALLLDAGRFEEWLGLRPTTSTMWWSPGPRCRFRPTADGWLSSMRTAQP
jgi:hypothetical protein